MSINVHGEYINKNNMSKKLVQSLIFNELAKLSTSDIYLKCIKNGTTGFALNLFQINMNSDVPNSVHQKLYVGLCGVKS